jgi:putative ABC transport system permease protein
MLQDVKFALRLFNRHRGYAAMAILSVALGVGANTAVFSIADSVLFRPLPYPDSTRLFMLRKADLRTGALYGRMPTSNFDAARATDLFEAFAGVPGFSMRAYVREEAGLGALSLALVPREYTEILGVRPVLGRSFEPADDGSRAVMLSYRTWLSKYGGNPSVVGTLLSTPDQPLRIVGVLPPRFRATLALGDGLVLLTGTFHEAPPIVRLKQGVSVQAAQARLNALRGEELEPGVSGFRLVPLREEMSGRQERLLWLLLAASGIVLLVACVNLANLVLALAGSRARELAIRTALGGSAARIIRLLLVESACLSVAGTAVGLIVAYWGFRVLASELPPFLERVADPSLDLRAFGFAVACACVATIAFGALPAWRLSRADARDGLRLGQLQAQPVRRGRQLLVALEISVTLALLAGAGLVGRSLLTLVSQDLGFARHRIVVTFDLPYAMIRTARSTRVDVGARIRFTEELLRESRNIRGIRAAGAVSVFPFSGQLPDAPLFDASGEAAGGVYSASAGYFRAMGTAFVEGRDFTDDESFSGASVGVLNESAAHVLCGTANCIGRLVNAPKQPPRTVIGVVKDVRESFRIAPRPLMFVPFDASRFKIASLLIDADDTASSRQELRRALSSSPDALVQVRSLDDAFEREVSPFRFNAIVVGAFAGLTLVMSVIGVYGVMAALVGERTREYGVRLALGATRGRVNRYVLRQALAPVGTGITVGLLLASWSSRYVASLLYGIVPLDVASFVAAATVVLVSAFMAALIPARRAGQVDPIVALRTE